MRINSTFRVLVFLTIGLVFNMSFVTRAQQNSVEAQAIIDAATADANKDVNKPL